MSELSGEDYFAFIFILMIFIWGLSIFLFGRISVKHIEREMAKEGGGEPIWDKGIGSRVVTYSLIMIFPKLNPPIVDAKATRRFMRKKDFYLALFLQISFAIFMVLMVTWSFLYGPD